MGRAKKPSSEASPTGLILHVGAGRCAELSSYLSEKPRKVLLIEPQPDRARRLEQRTRDQAEVEVLAAAVDGAGTGDGRFKIFNLRDYSSLRSPSGLYETFPGLRTTHEVDVETIDITDVVARENLTEDENHKLVIDAPGEEASIVAALASADLLTHFQRIDLYCGTLPLYEGAESSREIVARLAACGYDVQETDAAVDADRPRVTMLLSPIKVENIALQKKVDALVAECDRFKNELAEVTKARDEACKSLREIEERLTKVTESRDELQTRDNERNRQLAERQQELQRIQADDAERREREERMQEEIARAEAQIDLIKELVLREEGP